MSRWRRCTGAHGSRRPRCFTTVSQICRARRPRKRPPVPRCTKGWPVLLAKCRPFHSGPASCAGPGATTTRGRSFSLRSFFADLALPYRLTLGCAVDHPRRVITVAKRLSALALALALMAGNAAVCAGWMSSPEARMACCSEGGACPMHRGSSHDSGSDRVTQAQADSCCADV